MASPGPSSKQTPKVASPELPSEQISSQSSSLEVMSAISDGIQPIKVPRIEIHGPPEEQTANLDDSPKLSSDSSSEASPLPDTSTDTSITPYTGSSDNSSGQSSGHEPTLQILNLPHKHDPPDKSTLGRPDITFEQFLKLGDGASLQQISAPESDLERSPEYDTPPEYSVVPDSARQQPEPSDYLDVSREPVTKRSSLRSTSAGSSPHPIKKRVTFANHKSSSDVSSTTASDRPASKKSTASATDLSIYSTGSSRLIRPLSRADQSLPRLNRFISHDPSQVVIPASFRPHHFFFRDCKSNVKYLVDTESDLSVYPLRSLREVRKPTDFKLRTAHGTTSIPTFGFTKGGVDFSLGRNHTWRFTIADVTTPIIGKDFLAYHKLFLDKSVEVLVDTCTKDYAIAETSDEVLYTHAIKVYSGYSDYHKMLEEYPDITRPSGVLRNTQHRTTHQIRTIKGPPIRAQPELLTTQQYEYFEEKLRDMVDDGTARYSDSPWSSPLDLKRHEHNWHPTGNYKNLNKMTKPGTYPPKHIHDFTHQVAGCKVFSSLKLIQNYNQIPINPADIPKTAVATPFGHFEFMYMTFGLRNSTLTYQKYLDEMIDGLLFCVSYSDEIIVFSRDEDQHKEHLRKLYERLKTYDIVLNPLECKFDLKEVTLLEFSISEKGTKLRDCTKVHDCPLPQNAQQLRRFLGNLNNYRRFLPNIGSVQAPLQAMLKPGVKGSYHLRFTDDALQAFEKCKDNVENAKPLAHPDCKAPLSISTSISRTAIGATLQQRKNSRWVPLGHFSKSLSEAKTKYSNYNKEILVVSEAIRYFNEILRGRHFIVWTRNNKIKSSIRKHKISRCLPRLLTKFSYILQFNPDVRHASRKASTLWTKLPQLAGTTLSLNTLIAAQTTDAQLVRLLEKKQSLKLELIKIPGDDYSIVCDTSTNRPRPFVTKALRQQIFDSFHFLIHQGLILPPRSVQHHFIWPGINNDCQRWEKTCRICPFLKGKQALIAAGTKPANLRYKKVHVSILGPFEASNENTYYCLVVIDCLTRWPEAIPLENIEITTVANAFMTGWISKFGYPETFMLEKNRPFEFSRFGYISKVFRLKYKLIDAPCEPNCRHVKHGVCDKLTDAIDYSADNNWMENLPWIMLGIRNIFKNQIGVSPAEILYGEPVRAPLNFDRLHPSIMLLDTHLPHEALDTVRRPAPGPSRGFYDESSDSDDEVFYTPMASLGRNPNRGITKRPTIPNLFGTINEEGSSTES